MRFQLAKVEIFRPIDNFRADPRDTWRLKLPEIILPLPDTRLAVLDGVLRTVVEAGVAVGAVAVPLRAAVFQGDVLQRTHTHAFAA